MGTTRPKFSNNLWYSVVQIWRSDGTAITNLTRGHTGNVNSITWAPDGQMLATGSDDKTVRVWNVEGKPLVSFVGHTGAIHSVAWAPNGNIIASSADDNTVRLWDIPKELLP